MPKKKEWALTFEDDKLVLKAKDGKDRIVLMEGLDEEKKKVIGTAIAGIIGALCLLGILAVINQVSESLQKIGALKK